MSAREHLLVRASAGTGKTYRLTNRYLALVLGGVDPDRVLATTFTRKAAHEILERVLARLADAARPTEKGRAELAALSEAAGRALTADDCLTALERLLRGVDRVRIGTIDAFFAQIARLFALDLGLPQGWRIADEAEADALRAEAVAEAIAGAGKLEMLDLLRDLAKQSHGQSAHAELLRFARTGREALLESAPDAWRRIEALADVEPATLAAAVAAVPALVLPRSKSGKSAGAEKKNWATSRAKLVDAVARGDWAGVLGAGLAQKVCAGEVEYDRSPIEAHHRDVVGPLVAHALHFVTRRLAIQNQAARSLMERYEEHWRARSRESGLVRFEDLPDALAPISGDDPLRSRGVDLAHRLDGSVDHLLLDEFQDTSPVQWRALRPLAESILSDAGGGRSFFSVGDEKQSIYGWRAAEPRLLRGLAQGRPSLDVQEMHESQRSSRAVLDTVNAVFGSIATNAAFEDEDADVVEAAREFQSGFKAHAPVARHRDRPGAAFLVRARLPDEGEAPHAPVLAATVERVCAILRDAPGASVGVLLRRRAWIPELIHALREAGTLASDEGGNPLTDSVAVLHALSLLHLADHPGDGAAAFHIATSPLGRKVGLDEGLFAQGRRRAEAPDPLLERCARVAREVRGKLASLGYGAFLVSTCPLEGDGYDAWDLRRYGQLVDLALAWEDRASARPSAFVEHVRRTKVEDPSAAQVRVMTVHGAKGLQFDAVVLPELDRSMKMRDQGLWSMRPDPEGAIEVVTHSVAKEVARAHAGLAPVRAEVSKRVMAEELCVLYVAMTRAVHRLDLIVQGKTKEGSTLSNAAILRGALGVAAAGDPGVAWSSSAGTERWWREEIGPEGSLGPPGSIGAPGPLEEPASLGMHGGAVAPAPSERAALRLAPSRGPRALPARSPSRAKDDSGANEFVPTRASRLLLPHDATTARGRAVHRLLAEVEWIDTFDRSDEDLLAIVRRLEPDERIATAALTEFRALVQRPGLRKVLSKPSGDVEVWRERPFAVLLRGANGNEELWTGSFDRVVLRRETGCVASADVVDFKTDRVGADGLEERARAYRPQMDGYRRALASMLGLPENLVTTRIAFVAGDVVIDVA